MEQNDYFYDFLPAIQALWKKKIWIVLIALAIAAAVTAYVAYTVPPTYEADVMLYVNNNSVSMGAPTMVFNAGELSAARELVDTYLIILQSRNMLSRVIEKAELPYTTDQLSRMITAGALNDTEIIRVVIADRFGSEATLIANTIAEVFPEALAELVPGSTVEVIDEAVKARGKVSPNLRMDAVISFAAAFIALCVIVILKERFSTKVRGEDTLAKMYPEIPVLVTVPCHGGKRRKKAEK